MRIVAPGTGVLKHPATVRYPPAGIDVTGCHGVTIAAHAAAVSLPAIVMYATMAPLKDAEYAHANVLSGLALVSP